MKPDAARDDGVGDGPEQEPHLTVAVVARMLGIAPATLRTWDRRYGVGPSAHESGRHRRYSPHDVARLENMQRALVRGAAPAEAARFALAGSTEHGDEGGAAAAEWSPPAEAARPRAGGQMLRLPGAGRYARGLGRAALALDFPATRTLLIEAIAAFGVQVTWNEVARPVLEAVGQRWAETGLGVEIEHLLSQGVTAAFSAHALAVTATSTRPILLAAMPGEQHVLPLFALAADLADHGVTARPLGSDLPVNGLVAAMRRTTPAAVVLWSQLAATADVTVLSALPVTRPRVRAFVAGSGWSHVVVPPRVQVLGSLDEAVQVLVAAAAG